MIGILERKGLMRKGVKAYSQRHPESPGVPGEGEGGLFRIS